MTAPELAESPAPAVRGPARSAGEWRIDERWRVALIVGGLTVLGAVLRAIVADQSIFADELSTYWISATHGLGGVLSLLYGTGRIAHAEITPPLSFLLSWLTTRLGHSPELLRLPELIAGIATIPVVYALGLRTVGRRAALIATAVTTLAPFEIYYSAEARAYGLMMLAVLVSTLAMLRAVESGRTRWWALYAVSVCAAFYLHYTCVFVLAAQLVWLFWAHPPARRAASLATLAAGVGALPWIPGLINDLRSPTLKILSALSPFTPYDIRLDLEHWLIGYPYTFAGGLTRLPGTPSLILLIASVLVCLAGLAVGRAGRRAETPRGRNRRMILIAVLALATPVGEAVISVAGNHLFGVRNLAASWPYLALAGAAVLAALGPGWRTVATGLAVVAFGLAAIKMVSPAFQRPDYQGAAAYVSARARPGDVVIDETGALSPGPLTGLDVSLSRRLPVFRAQAPAERTHPYGFGDPIVSFQQAIDSAVAAAHGHRVFVVKNVLSSDIGQLEERVNPAPGRFPSGYRFQTGRAFPGLGGMAVAVYADARVGGA